MDDTDILILGATNRPYSIDTTVRRRFEKRIMIPLPEPEARYGMIANLIKDTPNTLTNEDIEYLAKNSDGYSGSDMSSVVKDAVYAPIRKA